MLSKWDDEFRYSTQVLGYAKVALGGTFCGEEV